MQRARATDSFGANARDALRRSSFARAKSPSCASAMPRRARAGASSRRATRFNAPRGSPAARARAAAVIRESIGIPPHLSLPAFWAPASVFLHEGRTAGHIRGRAKEQDFNKRRRMMTTAMKTPAIVSQEEWEAARQQLLVKE